MRLPVKFRNWRFMWRLMPSKSQMLLRSKLRIRSCWGSGTEKDFLSLLLARFMTRRDVLSGSSSSKSPWLSNYLFGRFTSTKPFSSIEDPFISWTPTNGYYRVLGS